MEKIKVYAPIIIPTMCRYEHLKRCLETLSNCKYASSSDLIIGLDYPLAECHKRGYNKICKYLADGIKGFSSVKVLRTYVNLGASKNIRRLKKYAVENFDRFIFTEDDNIFSPNFLEYMNVGLEKYKDNLGIFAICGYMYPIDNIDMFKSSFFKLQHFSAWGYGIWTDRNEIYESYKNRNRIKELLNNKFLITKLKKNRFGEIINLLWMFKTENILGDSLSSTILLHENKSVIFPKKTLVRNEGWDGSGIHGGIVKAYLKQEIDISNGFKFEEVSNIIESTKINHLIYSYWKSYTPLYRKILDRIIWIIFQVSHKVYTFDSLLGLFKKIRKKYYVDFYEKKQDYFNSKT